MSGIHLSSYHHGIQILERNVLRIHLNNTVSYQICKKFIVFRFDPKRMCNVRCYYIRSVKVLQVEFFFFFFFFNLV